MTPTLDLPNGYYELPPGRMANVVTCLEMTSRPDLAAASSGGQLVPFGHADLAGYRELFRAVGEPWLWFSRLVMPDEELQARLRNPEIYAAAYEHDGQRIGLLELDFREPAQCEIALFGLVPGAAGRGLGQALMRNALQLAWRPGVERVWLHTCTFDSPQAIPFYVRSGFKAYARMVELHDDPRLTGRLPLTAAPHIPVIAPSRVQGSH